MKAVVLKTDHRFELEEVEEPKLEKSTDVVVKVTKSAICGSDIHTKHGLIPGVVPGTIIGHEFVGVVHSAGPDVIQFKPGDRVAASPTTWCGVCGPCRRGEPQHCVNGRIFGGPGGLQGAQTELVRVPFADNCLMAIPDNVKDDDAVFVGDVLVTGYSAAYEGKIKTADTVVIFGCGPIGIGALIGTLQFGPKRVFAVDMMDKRLALAKSFGAVTLDAREGRVVERIREATHDEGADVALEAAGAPEAFLNAVRSVRRGGMVSVVGIFPAPVEIPLHELCLYGVKISMGLGSPSANDKIMGLVEGGRIQPGPLATHVFPLDSAIEAYELFEYHKEDCVKVLLEP